ncbi:hypothetical protein EVAR_34718_1 [Eumeta japonica]|uniref:Uncharacterized protein n=1 Tax=Eumeta variegata TaxID=151549 RepID=A0A4C1XES2_EUMVA|nr:hypothetical protein EVAR_34718_1 [Eumeta japonica]
MSLSGSVNTQTPLTEFCYDEGDTFTANCYFDYGLSNEGITWHLHDVNDNEVYNAEEIPRGYQPSSWWLPSSPIRLNLDKRHDNWLLKCQRSFILKNIRPIALNGSIAVRFRMRRDDACQVYKKSISITKLSPGKRYLFPPWGKEVPQNSCRNDCTRAAPARSWSTEVPSIHKQVDEAALTCLT